MSRFGASPATPARAEVLNAFMRGVYSWMTIGLALTAGLAWFVASSGMALQMAQVPFLFFGIIIAELVLVVYLSARISKIAASTATMLFLAYSALNGVTLSTVFLAYQLGAIFKAFAVAAGMFGSMSVYGLVTKKDLTSWGSFLFMGLIGVFIAMIVNIFLQSAQMDFIISILGVIVFTGLTAYDTQKLKVMGETAPHDDATAIRRGTIMGALTLYLDFINLFLMLLRLFGGSRD